MGSTRNRFLYVISFFSVLLVAVQSYFKQELIGGLQGVFPGYGNGVGLYWSIRLFLFFVFIFSLFMTAPVLVKPQVKCVDWYETERSLKDPLLGLRALACLNVFFGHWFMVVFGPSVPAQSSGDHALRFVLSFSPWCGVWIFFTLSGYLMGKGFVTGRHTIDRAGLARFYYNRARRIFPIYFISILMVAVFVKPEFLDLRTELAWGAFFDSVLFDQQGGGVIGALWSVSTEFQFYLMAPFLYLIMSPLVFDTKKLVILGVVVLGILCAGKFSILITHPERWHSRVYFPLLSNLDCFVSGMIAAFVVNNMRRRDFYLKRGMLIGVIFAALSQVVFSVWSFKEMASYQGFPGSSTRLYFLSVAPAVTAVLTCSIIFVFEISSRSAGRAGFLWRISGFLGAITYCLYVLHEPVVLSIRRLFPQNISMLDSVFVFPFGFVLCILIACIFYYLVESYFDKISYSKFRGYFLVNS